ncbi:hypothetical protein V6N11_018170 [Hibiscus sabdariffa]|uniref:Uncharacterized protein n=1 Tax=Hibiscus sabdariffa TaxID=183260 RepID=A0ABR2T6L7_9ROSI
MVVASLGKIDNKENIPRFSSKTPTLVLKKPLSSNKIKRSLENPFKTLPISFFPKSVQPRFNPIQLLKFWFLMLNVGKRELKMSLDRFSIRLVWCIKVATSDNSSFRSIC